MSVGQWLLRLHESMLVYAWELLFEALDVLMSVFGDA